MSYNYIYFTLPHSTYFLIKMLVKDLKTSLNRLQIQDYSVNPDFRNIKSYVIRGTSKRMLMDKTFDLVPFHNYDVSYSDIKIKDNYVQLTVASDETLINDIESSLQIISDSVQPILPWLMKINKNLTSTEQKFLFRNFSEISFKVSHKNLYISDSNSSFYYYLDLRHGNLTTRDESDIEKRDSALYDRREQMIKTSRTFYSPRNVNVINIEALSVPDSSDSETETQQPKSGKKDINDIIASLRRIKMQDKSLATPQISRIKSLLNTEGGNNDNEETSAETETENISDNATTAGGDTQGSSNVN